MSEYSQLSQERAFHCPQCNGRIVIPSNLPPTTGPCPHCQTTITSPEPIAQATEIQENLKPVLETRPAPIPIPTSVSAEKHDETATPVEETKSDKSTKRTNPTTLILVFILLLISLGGAAYFVIDFLKPKSEPKKKSTTSNLVRIPANPVLIKYLAASTLDEKLNFVYNADELRPKLEAFYKDGKFNESDTPAGSFSLVKLPEMDSQKGFMLLTYDQPAAAPNGQTPPKTKPENNLTAQRTKILAFLKETDSGVKLDWEVFAQTRYRTFNQFIKTPVIGKSEVFRVIVSHAPVDKSAAEKPNISYKFHDPAHLGDNVEISPDKKSQAGQALARLNVENAKQPGDVNRTATVELTWTGDPSAPQLEIKRFICWEFLGLGGKEIAEINPSN